MTHAVVRPLKRMPSHPGSLLKTVIEDAGRKKTEIADMLKISRQHLYDILNEQKPVTAPVAARLGKLFGNGGSLWLGMQNAYDLWQAENTIDLSEIPELKIA